MDDTYRHYIHDGEVIYAQKADSLKAYPGRHRIKLSWPIGPDKKVVGAMISWNSGEQKMDHQIIREPGLDTVHVWLIDLDEGGYAIDVVTYDKYGNHSVKINTYAEALGDDYESHLVNGVVRSASTDGATAFLEWYTNTTQDAVAMEVVHIDQNDQPHTTTLPLAENVLVLPDYKPGSVIEYRTLYIPGGIAVDTFYSEYHSIIPLSAPKKLPNPTPIMTLAGDYNQFYAGLDYMNFVDGDVTNIGETAVGETSALPQSFTLDFHVPTTFDHFKYFMWPTGASYEFAHASPERWEVWGSNELDGDWGTWTKIMDCVAIKPSGSPLGTLTTADMEASREGLEFEFPEGTPPYRYLRWKTTKTFGDIPAVGIAEITFWGNQETPLQPIE
ncbi:DUF4998 domain-containing protein [Parapedobacter sp.]